MCNIEQIADCGDIFSLGRALFITEKEENTLLSQCLLSISPCGNLLAVGYKKRLCLLTSQWISANEGNSYLISWSGTLPSEITAVSALSICPSQQSSQNGPDWFCVVVGFQNGSIGLYTDTGHLLLHEKLDDKPALKISCHTGTYGTLPDDIHIFFQACVCIVSGSSLFPLLRNAKAQLARVQAGIQAEYTVDSRCIQIKKWTFAEQDDINDAAFVGLELKNTYDHFLAASTYGGYDTWYRSVPPMNNLILTAGYSPFLGFHYALEGGTTPPLQDVARAVANKIKSALPGWLGGSTETTPTNAEPLIRAEQLMKKNCISDAQRQGCSVVVSPDRRLAAFTDSLGRVSVLDITKGHLIKLFKGCRDAQCAFVQIFDADKKKPQLSVVKEIKRAIFLIIYNPKKGLIDIRLMQRGSRVAVFTATKNGRLLYNTCGLVGTEKNYTHKKLNLPEFQCILIDPDGKLKKFNIPFYHALDGEHLERSKDVHVTRSIREILKKTSSVTDDTKIDLYDYATKLKTLDAKKHCIEMLIKYCSSVDTTVACLQLFWDSLCKSDLDQFEEKVKIYFKNLALITQFYCLLNKESVENIEEVIEKLYNSFELERIAVSEDHKQKIEFQLLEDDTCILERLLILAQEKDYKQQQARVTFAENRSSSYKDFISCFLLDAITDNISLKPDLNSEKTNILSSDIFKSLLKLSNLTYITNYVKLSKINPKEIVKLVIINIMNLKLEEINIEMIEKVIAIIYYLCDSTHEASDIKYNKISPWWEDVRHMLVDMPCPLRSMIVAMACKAVSKSFESKSPDKEEAWESVTKENAKWGILIGKLEDISILSIILLCKDKFNGKTLPKLQVDEININLKYIYTRGQGSVTELIAKWLCSMGVPPEAVTVNELMEMYDVPSSSDSDEDDRIEYIIITNSRYLVDNNSQLFKWLSLLQRQFPLSTKANYLIANMCWEYAMMWQKDMNKMDMLDSVIHCLDNISDLHLRLGLFSIIWSTYIKQIFEPACRLVNKVGKLPKDHLCLQDLGINSECLVTLLKITNKFLNNFRHCLSSSSEQEKISIRYEKIWDESLPSLVEVAQDTKNVNADILSLNYQISCTIFYQCQYNFKFSKPLDTLYDIDYEYLLEALSGAAVSRDISMKCSEKLKNPRMKYLTKVIRKAIDAITVDSDTGAPNALECQERHEDLRDLARLWGIDTKYVNRQCAIAFYHGGYDDLAIKKIPGASEPETLLSPILAITVQRLKRSLQNSSNQPEWIVSVPPKLYKRLQNTELDTSIPADPSLTTTASVLRTLLYQVSERSIDAHIAQEVKLAEMIIDNCEMLNRRKL